MKDHSLDRDAGGVDRLPDVRPSRPDVSYASFAFGVLTGASRQANVPERFDEPAWWERDEPATLPDARRWRAGSVVGAHLPLALRSALDQAPVRSGPQPTVWSFGNIANDTLGESRLGPDDEIPVLSPDDIARERSAWRDDVDRAGSDRKGKRNKAGRKDRRGDGSGRPSRRVQ